LVVGQPLFLLAEHEERVNAIIMINENRTAIFFMSGGFTDF
jgi:hypothetical protein